jgi:hypothetical protein
VPLLDQFQGQKSDFKLGAPAPPPACLQRATAEQELGAPFLCPQGGRLPPDAASDDADQAAAGLRPLSTRGARLWDGEASWKELEEERGKTGRRNPQRRGGDGQFLIQTRLYRAEPSIASGKCVIILVISLFRHFIVEHKFGTSVYAWRNLEVYSE